MWGRRRRGIGEDVGEGLGGGCDGRGGWWGGSHGRMKVFGGGGMLRWWRKMVGGAENRALGDLWAYLG